MDEDHVMVSPEPGVRMDEVVSQASNHESGSSSKNGVVDKDNNVITVPPVMDTLNCDPMDGQDKVISSRRTPSPGVSQQQCTSNQPQKMFTLKRWNAVSMWSWDVECDTCAICRVHVMDACLRCQSESKSDECVVVWGECNHSFHNCCMSLWVQQNNRCPLCQQDWHVQRIGK